MGVFSSFTDFKSIQTEMIELCKWDTFDKSLDEVEEYEWMNKFYFSKENLIYKKIVLSIGELLDKNLFFRLSVLYQLEKHHNIVTLYDTLWVDDPFMGKGFTNDTQVTIYVINDLIENKEKIIHHILFNIHSDFKIYESKYKHGTIPFKTFVSEFIRQKNEKVKLHSPASYDKFLESDLERFIINNLEKLESGLEIIKNQYEVENGIIDILAKDREGRICIIELKIVTDCKNIVFQSAYYPTQFDNTTPVRMITICPDYKGIIKSALRNLKNVEMYKYYFLGDKIFFEKVE